jgi:hypothetical protein
VDRIEKFFEVKRVYMWYTISRTLQNCMKQYNWKWPLCTQKWHHIFRQMSPFRLRIHNVCGFTFVIYSLCLSVCLPTTYLPACLPACLSICLSIYLSIYLPTYLSIYLSIYLSLELFMARRQAIKVVLANKVSNAHFTICRPKCMYHGILGSNGSITSLSNKYLRPTNLVLNKLYITLWIHKLFKKI